jgi:Pyridoxamine 5'-phosphate oxidase
MPGHSLDHAGLETLPFALCLRLLASVPVGRVGFVADGEVQVLPVNHVLDGQDVVFRTAHGSKLSAAEGEKPITFEVDDYDERTHSGWSVVVTGRSEPPVLDPDSSHLGDRASDPAGVVGSSGPAGAIGQRQPGVSPSVRRVGSRAASSSTRAGPPWYGMRMRSEKPALAYRSAARTISSLRSGTRN